MPMNPAVGRSIAPFNPPPVKIDVVNAAPAVFRNSLRSAVLFCISGPSKLYFTPKTTGFRAPVEWRGLTPGLLWNGYRNDASDRFTRRNAHWGSRFPRNSRVNELVSH